MQHEESKSWYLIVPVDSISTMYLAVYLIVFGRDGSGITPIPAVPISKRHVCYKFKMCLPLSSALR